jgi:hypothetical protein
MRCLFILFLLVAFTGGRAVAEQDKSEESPPLLCLISGESRGITQ